MNNIPIVNIKTPLIYGTFGIVMLILICIIIGLLFSSGKLPNGENVNVSTTEVNTAFIIIAFMSAFLLLIFMIIPNYKEFLKLIGELKYVLFIVIYIIGLIIFYRDIPTNIINAYSFIFLPITILFGIYLFYLAMKTPLYSGFDLNYERVKYALIYFCLIIFILLLYTTNPGGYLKAYFGPSLVITILLVIFGFLYLITLMTFPYLQTVNKNGTTSINQTGFFDNLSSVGIFSVISFIIFLIIVVSGILAYPGGFLTNPSNPTISLIVILIICVFVLWILFFGILSFSDTKLRDNTGNINKSMLNISSIARQVFMLLFGLIFSGLLIGWLVVSVEGLSSNSGIISFILNLLIVIIILGLVFKLITEGSYYKKSPLFRFIINTVLYIPCIAVNVLDTVFSLIMGLFEKFGISKPKLNNINITSTLTSGISNIKNTPYTYYIILIAIILLYLLYYVIFPQFQKNISKQGGTLLVNSPIPINSENIIGMYDNLNGTNSDTNPYEYQYAISFWVFIDAISPNTNSALEKYTSLLDYGGKPNILYNASENTLMVTMLNTSGTDVVVNPQKLDVNGNFIIYKMKNVLLQKWNNIIINYNSGILDIFYNGKLIKSVNHLIPKMSKDTLIIGSNNGVNGSICNVSYFNTSISSSQVYYLYNTVKNKTPPISNSSKESIVKNVLNSVNIKTNPQVITIPINIDITSKQQHLPNTVGQDIVQPIISDPTNTYVDYLSFKWFSSINL